MSTTPGPPPNPRREKLRRQSSVVQQPPPAATNSGVGGIGAVRFAGGGGDASGVGADSGGDEVEDDFDERAAMLPSVTTSTLNKLPEISVPPATSDKRLVLVLH